MIQSPSLLLQLEILHAERLGSAHLSGRDSRLLEPSQVVSTTLGYFAGVEWFEGQVALDYGAHFLNHAGFIGTTS